MRCKSSGISIALAALLFLSIAAFAADPIDIQTSHHSARELQEKLELEQLLKKYDVSKYTFTRTVVIEERAMNHAFPVLTLNVHFLGSDDELLSSFLHEQLHWYLAQHRLAMEDAVRQLKATYPRAPVGLPEGADTEYSTYGHLIDCYLEIRADRELMGRERTDRVIKNKPWYTWIYRTILRDEDRIAALVKAEHLELNASTSTPSTMGEHFEPNEYPPNPVVVMPWEIPCKEETVQPNFEVRVEQHVTGVLSDRTGAPIQDSKVILRKRDDGEFVDYRQASTDNNGQFDLGLAVVGSYRFLAASRGFKQPTKVECSDARECKLNLVLQIRPSDQPFGGCPIQ
jgi:hypothetical protein